MFSALALFQGSTPSCEGKWWIVPAHVSNSSKTNCWVPAKELAAKQTFERWRWRCCQVPCWFLLQGELPFATGWSMLKWLYTDMLNKHYWDAFGTPNKHLSLLHPGRLLTILQGTGTATYDMDFHPPFFGNTLGSKWLLLEADNQGSWIILVLPQV